MKKIKRLLLCLNIFAPALAIGINSVAIYYYFFPTEVICERCGC